MRSPFKFLDSYTLEDKAVFFGRDQETDELYELVYKSPLILLYGMSGTGKTSLIQCGLASKFSGPDWFPLWIRRYGDINESLKIALQKATKGSKQQSLRDGISYLFRYYLRPVYLIFDQFEELFVLGTTEEQEQFMHDIQDLLESELPVKILFSMREEYLGQLYHFEKMIPTLFDHRLRVEPMNQKKVREVLSSSFQQFNVRLEGKEEDRLEEIIQNISGSRSLIQLPYLQVYLDKLYREDFERTYGAREREADEFPELVLTQEEIKSFGKIDDVLERFLEEKEKEIQDQLNVQHPELPNNTVNQIINQFVTEDGTKKPIYFTREGDDIVFEPKIYDALPKLPRAIITQTILDLEKNRLLRFSDNSMELAHDTLGAVIDQKRTEEQRQLNNVLRQIKVAYNAFPRTGEYLSRKQLNFFEPSLPKLQFELSDKILQFIEDSRVHVGELENKERLRIERELALAEEKLKAEQEAQEAKAKQLEEANRAAKRQRFFLGLVSIIAVAALAAMVFGILKNIEVNQRNKEILEGNYQNYNATAKSLRNARNFELALAQLDSAKTSANLIGKSDSLAQLTGQWQSMFALIEESDTLKANGNLYQALQKLGVAIEMDPGFVLIKNEYEDLNAAIDKEYTELISSASSMETLLGGINPIICELYRKAAQLKPDASEVVEKLKSCE